MISFIRKLVIFFLPNNYVLKSRLKDGSVIRGQNKAGYGGRGVYIKRETIEPEINLLNSIVKDGDIVLDIGANVGVYTVVMAKIIGDSGLVIAFEPFPIIASMNLRNVLENDLNNVRLRVSCVSDFNGNQDFWMKNNKPNSFTLLETPGSSCFNSKVTSIDTIFHEEGIGKIDFIKIDAEGVENKIIRGAQNVIQKCSPIFLVEATITNNTEIPANYQVLKYPGSHNVLLVPNRSNRLSSIKNAGFQVIQK